MIQRIVIVIGLMISLNTFSQKIKLQNIEGSWIISNISPEEAKKKAIEEAKTEALRRAGVSESVSSFSFGKAEDDGKSVKDFFQSITSVQLSGSIVDWELVSEQKSINSENNIVIRVTINATVQKYKSKKDDEFIAKIEDLASNYKSDQALTFAVTPNIACYLTVFIVGLNNEVFQLTPNETEKQLLLEAKKRYQYPLSKLIDYTLFTELDQEANTILFFFSKKDVPYTKELTFDGVINYIYSFEPDERFLDIQTFTIFKK